MANSSELLHFLKQDVDISPYLKESHQVLAQSVQMAFRHLVQCVEQELRTLMSAFIDITEDADMEDSDVESMMDPDAPDNMAGERSFSYGQFGRPIGGDSWLGKLSNAFLCRRTCLCSHNKLLVVLKFCEQLLM